MPLVFHDMSLSWIVEIQRQTRQPVSPNAIMMFDATGTVVNGLCTIHGHHHSSLPSCWDRRLADACHRNLREAPAQPIPLAPPLSRHDYIPEIVCIYIYIYISYIYISYLYKIIKINFQITDPGVLIVAYQHHHHHHLHHHHLIIIINIIIIMAYHHHHHHHHHHYHHHHRHRHRHRHRRRRRHHHHHHFLLRGNLPSREFITPSNNDEKAQSPGPPLRQHSRWLGRSEPPPLRSGWP